MAISLTVPRFEVRGVSSPAFLEIWTPEAENFVCELVAGFAPRIDILLRQRAERQKKFDAGLKPDFLIETKSIREAEWKVAPIPLDIVDRRVEITGPVERKMIINALNSGAKVFMADFEDSSSPTWGTMIEGQLNLRDAVQRTISFTSAEGKRYSLNNNTAVLMVRPRGLHLSEKHIFYNERAIPASLMDFGLYFYHNWQALLVDKTAPYFYLPKLQSHLEARLWNDIFNFAQDRVGTKRGTIRATVLIETLPAAFEMDEILYELRDHSAGLNCGRWDYIFSFIKCFRSNEEFVLPDREQVTMLSPFLQSYSKLLIHTCHRRGIHAMGGMAAQIPIKNNLAANEIAMNKVRGDKEREAVNGHDGTWVAHPDLVPIAMDVFNKHMPDPNQIHREIKADVLASDLIAVPEGTITIQGLTDNVGVSLRYLEAWLCGSGCVPLNNLMEDAATAEIARTQIWQWIQYPRGKLVDGRKITIQMVRALISQEMMQIREQYGTQYSQHKFDAAAQVLDRLLASNVLANFLTVDAYELLP